MRSHNPALDGIRALAVGAVVALHLEIGPLRAGWLGVDIFFVLSGYLITGLLLREQALTGRIRFGAFYVRRLTRLYPALIIACGLALAFGRHGTTVIGAGLSVAYLSDVFLAMGGDLGALGPTWSLAVEEHFYLVWPAFVAALRSRRRVAIAASLLGFASLVAFFWINPPGRDLSAFAYNSDHLRAWELLAGCVLACAPQLVLTRGWEVVLLLMAGGGTALCSYAPLWPAGRDVRMAMVAVLVAAVLVVCAGHDGVAHRALSARPLPQIGAISYGLYLYHVPLLDLVDRLPSRRAVELAVYAPVLLAVAWASHRFIETPIRQWGRRVSQRPPVSSRQTVLT